MRTTRIALCVLALSIPLPMLAHGQTPPAESLTPTTPTLADVDPDLLQAVIADQWDRGMDMFGGRPAKMVAPPDWNAIATRDKERQALVRALVSKGALKSAREYQFAALIFQHSPEAADLRLAHLLAVTAALKGQPTAKWLAAAALDRYLWNTNQPQIFGNRSNAFDELGKIGEFIAHLDDILNQPADLRQGRQDAMMTFADKSRRLARN